MHKKDFFNNASLKELTHTLFSQILSINIDKSQMKKTQKIKINRVLSKTKIPLLLLVLSISHDNQGSL